MSGNRWGVEVSFPIDGQFGFDEKKEQKLLVLAEKFRGRRWSSGSGFGVRDVGFEFPAKEMADAFSDEARRMKDVEVSEVIEWQQSGERENWQGRSGPTRG